VTPTVRSSRVATQPREPLTPSRPLELVDPDEWKQRRRARLTAGIFIVVLVVSPFVIVVMNVQMAQRQIQLQHLRTALTREQRQYETLREQVLQRSSPAGIAQAAQDLGLAPAGPVTVVTVPPADASSSTGNDAGLAAADDDVTRNKLADAP
jgi:cell division protein FtsL